MPPVYEYKCDNDCGNVETELKPVSECREPIQVDCVCLTEADTLAGNVQSCTHKRILSATPTTFRFNDRTGFEGLDKKRGS